MACGYEYHLYYNEKVRLQAKGSALVFGGAIDKALDVLLLTKDLETAQNIFLSQFENLPTTAYHENDTDMELLTQEEAEENAPYHSLRRKGLVMLESYHDEILPRIKRVIQSQREVLIKTEAGDEFIGLIDLLCEWEDGRILLVDNKTSAFPYDFDAVSKSVQLACYKELVKSEIKIDAYAFFVIQKGLKKNRKKTCLECGFDGSEGRHATCPAKRNNARCEGAWDVKIFPQAYIQVLIDDITDHFSNMVIENFDLINDNIKNQIFHRNFQSCSRGKDRKCDYYNLCHFGSMKGLVKK